jgi:hypothetical protein
VMRRAGVPMTAREISEARRQDGGRRGQSGKVAIGSGRQLTRPYSNSTPSRLSFCQTTRQCLREPSSRITNVTWAGTALDPAASSIAPVREILRTIQSIAASSNSIDAGIRTLSRSVSRCLMKFPRRNSSCEKLELGKCQTNKRRFVSMSASVHKTNQYRRS